MTTSATGDRGWVVGPSIIDRDTLARLEDALENSPVVVEHRFFMGGRAPKRFVVDDFEVLRTYLNDEAHPGDSIWIWRFDDVCRDDNAVAHGKVPNDDGLVPRGGAY